MSAADLGCWKRKPWAEPIDDLGLVVRVDELESGQADELVHRVAEQSGCGLVGPTYDEVGVDDQDDVVLFGDEGAESVLTLGQRSGRLDDGAMSPRFVATDQLRRQEDKEARAQGNTERPAVTT